MIDYNRKLSNERETQVPSPRMSTLVQLETLIFIKNCQRQCYAILCTVSNITTGPDSKLKLTAIGILNPFTYMDFPSGLNNKLEKVHCKHQGVTGPGSQVPK